MKLLTLDEAFSDEHFQEVEEKLFELNSKEISDISFLHNVQNHVSTFEAKCNVHDLINVNKGLSGKIWLQ